jgi:hypothetical protein
MVYGTCALCHENAPIKKSHIIPKFAVEYLKRTSATGYIRQAVNPNLRKQDIERTRLLCSRCESKLSLWEKRFSESLFVPIVEGDWRDLQYGEWLLRFAVSLAWRLVAASSPEARRYNPVLAPRVDEACETWAAFLRDETRDAGQYEHHISMFNLITDASFDIPPGFQWYLMRTVDYTLVWGDTRVLTYVKLPGMAFWSAVHPPHVKQWDNTQILDKGRIALPQAADTNVLQFLLDRAAIYQASLASLSDRQRSAIGRAVLADPGRAAASRSVETIAADRALLQRQSSKKRSIERPDP